MSLAYILRARDDDRHRNHDDHANRLMKASVHEVPPADAGVVSRLARTARSGGGGI
jgi:hypothetical protein